MMLEGVRSRNKDGPQGERPLFDSTPPPYALQAVRKAYEAYSDVASWHCTCGAEAIARNAQSELIVDDIRPLRERLKRLFEFSSWDKSVVVFGKAMAEETSRQATRCVIAAGYVTPHQALISSHTVRATV